MFLCHYIGEKKCWRRQERTNLLAGYLPFSSSEDGSDEILIIDAEAKGWGQRTNSLLLGSWWMLNITARRVAAPPPCIVMSRANGCGYMAGQTLLLLLG